MNLDELYREAKELAKECKLPIISAVQTPRPPRDFVGAPPPEERPDLILVDYNTLLRPGKPAERWGWPVPGFVPPEIPSGSHDGAFGVVRAHDIHTGVDLYCPEGTVVHAVEDGRVVRSGMFTGPDAESEWWLPTEYLFVEGASGVVCYGEIALDTEVSASPEVKKGQRLGTVLTVLKKDKGKPMSMLHLELYEPGYRGEPVWWHHGEPRPAGLMDPTVKLRQAEV